MAPRGDQAAPDFLLIHTDRKGQLYPFQKRRSGQQQIPAVTEAEAGPRWPW